MSSYVFQELKKDMARKREPGRLGLDLGPVCFRPASSPWAGFTGGYSHDCTVSRKLSNWSASGFICAVPHEQRVITTESVGGGGGRAGTLLPTDGADYDHCDDGSSGELSHVLVLASHT